MKLRGTHLFLCLLWLTVPLARGQEAKPLWELGVGGLGISQQAYPGSNQQRKVILAYPYGVYRGEFFRADNNGMNIKAYSLPGLEFDIGGAAALGSKSGDIALRQGMPNLGTLVEFGPRAKWYFDPQTKTQWRLELPLRGVFNLNRSLKDEGVSFEPQLVYEKSFSNPWFWQGSIGALYGDKRLNQMYYGVDAPYATAIRANYEAKSGLIAWRLKSTAVYSINSNFRVFGFAQWNTVAGGANAQSPLIDSKTGASYGIGLVYMLGKSSEMVTR